MSEIDLQDKIRTFLNTAFNHFIVSNYTETLQTLKSAEVLDKNNPEIIYNIAVTYCRMGLMGTAITYIDRLLSLPYTFIDNISVKKLLSYTLIETKNFERALSTLEEILHLTPEDITALTMKGYILEKQEFYHESAAIYEQILEQDPENTNASNSLAFILAHTDQNLTRALYLAQKACKSNTQSGAFLDTLGYVYLKQGDLKKAKALFQTAQKYSPLSEEIKNHLESIAHNGTK